MRVRRVEPIDLFVTNDFRKSPWVMGLCKRVMRPVWVTEEKMPRGHFGTFFGAMNRREYENHHIQDLYHLHELIHVIHTCYDLEATWLSWSQKMIAAEFEASVATECFAYLRIPGLRAKTFTHEIWFDELIRTMQLRCVEWSLKDEALIRRAEDFIRRERHRALNVPCYNDFLEHQIRNYGHQNILWCGIWASPVGYGAYSAKPAFRVVEAHMGSELSHDKGAHEGWLNRVSSSEGVPFAKQAEEFKSVYEASNKAFGNHLLTQ